MYVSLNWSWIVLHVVLPSCTFVFFCVSLLYGLIVKIGNEPSVGTRDDNDDTDIDSQESFKYQVFIWFLQNWQYCVIVVYVYPIYICVRTLIRGYKSPEKYDKGYGTIGTICVFVLNIHKELSRISVIFTIIMENYPIISYVLILYFVIWKSFWIYKSYHDQFHDKLMKYFTSNASICFIHYMSIFTIKDMLINNVNESKYFNIPIKLGEFKRLTRTNFIKQMVDICLRIIFMFVLSIVCTSDSNCASMMNILDSMFTLNSDSGIFFRFHLFISVISVILSVLQYLTICKQSNNIGKTIGFHTKFDDKTDKDIYRLKSKISATFQDTFTFRHELCGVTFPFENAVHKSADDKYNLTWYYHIYGITTDEINRNDIEQPLDQITKVEAAMAEVDNVCVKTVLSGSFVCFFCQVWYIGTYHCLVFV